MFDEIDTESHARFLSNKKVKSTYKNKMNFFIKISKLFSKLIRANYKFYFPSQKKILIFDYHGSNYIKKILPTHDYDILSVRYESLNVPIILKCLSNFKLSLRNYIKKYIHSVNPKILITIIDNNVFFYQIKLNNGKKFLIQGGRRTALPSDIFFNENKKKILKEKNFVDFMFVHNETIGREYKKLIKGRVINLGSIQSNIHKIDKFKKKFDLMYISTFRLPFYTNPNHQMFGKKYKYVDYMKREILLLKWLKNFADKNNRHLTILGVSISGYKEEKIFYESLLGQNGWNFIKRIPKRKTYKLIDQSFIILGIDSTLVYEAIGRGLRVGVFGIRGNSYPINSRKFGWPGKFANKGFFWTNFALEKEFKRVLNNLINVSPKKWNRISSKYKNKIHCYNFQNTIAKNLIKSNLR